MSTQLNKNLMKNIGWLSLLLCSQQAIADSYIYVTNTTPEKVSVNINHHGTRTLTQGVNGLKKPPKLHLMKPNVYCVLTVILG